MTRQEAIEILNLFVQSCTEWGGMDKEKEALDMAIYDMGIIDELRKERDAALEELESLKVGIKVAQGFDDGWRGAFDRECRLSELVKECNNLRKKYNEIQAERDAALNTAFAALKMRDGRKDG